MLKFRKKYAILNKGFGQHLEVGGKALINIYSRLYLIYGDETIFEMKNKEGIGFSVIVGGTF